MFSEPEFWVAVAFVILMGVFAYLGIHRTVLTGARSSQRAHQGRTRRRAPPQGRGRQAAGGIQGPSRQRRSARPQEIIASAKAEAERIAAEAKTKMEDFVARRTKTAESKIALAEAQALADVRAAAADAAVAAASTILSQSVKGQVADDLLAKGIAEVRAKLN